MSIFCIADTHLSLTCNKPMDIFGGWQDYEKRLEKHWRDLVKPEDTVVIAGDISWAMSLEQAKADFEFLNDLPGTKLISKGNHDYWWTTKKKMNDFLEENGFQTIKFIHNNAYTVGDFSICATRGWFFDCTDENDKKVLNREIGRLRASIKDGIKEGKEPIVFLHYPPIYEDQVCEGIYNVLIEYGIKRCYYGHLHSASCKRAFNGVADGIKFTLISSDFVDFTPVLIEKI